MANVVYRDLRFEILRLPEDVYRIQHVDIQHTVRAIVLSFVYLGAIVVGLYLHFAKPLEAIPVVIQPLVLIVAALLVILAIRPIWNAVSRVTAHLVVDIDTIRRQIRIPGTQTRIPFDDIDSVDVDASVPHWFLRRFVSAPVRLCLHGGNGITIADYAGKRPHHERLAEATAFANVIARLTDRRLTGRQYPHRADHIFVARQFAN